MKRARRRTCAISRRQSNYCSAELPQDRRFPAPLIRAQAGIQSPRKMPAQVCSRHFAKRAGVPAFAHGRQVKQAWYRKLLPPPCGEGGACGIATPNLSAYALSRGRDGRLFPRLHADHVAVVIHVPDRDRGGRIVDPGAPVVRIGLGQHILGPAVSLRVEAQHPP